MSEVSVIIPTHNRPEFLKRSIKSVLDQSYQDLELIIVDDGSKPTAQNIVDSFQDSRIRFIRQEVSRGGGTTRNIGIRAATGNFIAFLDDDDEWVPNKLAIQMEYFEGTPDDVGIIAKSGRAGGLRRESYRPSERKGKAAPAKAWPQRFWRRIGRVHWHHDGRWLVIEIPSGHYPPPYGRPSLCYLCLSTSQKTLSYFAARISFGKKLCKRHYRVAG